MGDKLNIEKITKEIQDSLKIFLGEKSNGNTIAAIQSSIDKLINIYLAEGLISKFPLIDVNNLKEIEYVKKQIKDLEELVKQDLCGQDHAVELHHKMTLLDWKLRSLERQTIDHHSPTIYFKNEDFTSFDFDKWIKNE